jgi:hypothetical protein
VRPTLGLLKQDVSAVGLNFYNAGVLQAKRERDDLAKEISECNSGRDMPEQYK